MLYEIRRNEEKNGNEIYFDGVPAAEVREALKANGCRWHKVKKCWYGRIDAVTIAAIIEGGEEAAAPFRAGEKIPEAEKKAAKRSALASLWERCRVDDLPGYGTENEYKKAATEEARRTGHGFDRCAAAIIRKHLRERFPEVKISVTSGGAGYLNSCDVRIISAPYEKITVLGDPCAASWTMREDHEEPGAALSGVLEYCKRFFDCFDADDGDIYADYGAHHDLYGGASLDWKFTATEPTEAQRADIADYIEKKKAHEEAEEAERLRAFEEEQKQRAAEAEQAAKIHAQNVAKAAEIAAAVTVEDIPEESREIVHGLRGGIGKECNIDELRENLKEETESAEVSRRVFFPSENLYNDFCGLFMYDWEFLTDKGGTGSLDPRITDENAQKLTREQRESVEFIMCDCVALYVGGELRAVVDPEGYSYARYVYIPGEDMRTETKTDYAERMQKTHGGEAFYIPAPVADQIETAAIQPGEVITVLSFDPWTMCATVRTGRADLVTVCDYAQYKNAGRVTYTENGKRKPTTKYIKPGEDFAIYRGELPKIPEAMQYEKQTTGAGYVARMLRNCGATAGEFVRDCLNYWKLCGFSPVVDTCAR